MRRRKECVHRARALRGHLDRSGTHGSPGRHGAALVPRLLRSLHSDRRCAPVEHAVLCAERDTMAEALADRFIEALERLETTHDPEPLVALFAEDCTLSTVETRHVFYGRDGARRFWLDYRGTFGDVLSSFRNIVADATHVMLEWTTQGTVFGGAQVQYEGVSVLEYEHGAIKRFHAYFDATRLGRQLFDRRGIEATAPELGGP
jgi:hypothetical protein